MPEIGPWEPRAWGAPDSMSEGNEETLRVEMACLLGGLVDLGGPWAGLGNVAS